MSTTMTDVRILQNFPGSAEYSLHVNIEQVSAEGRGTRATRHVTPNHPSPIALYTKLDAECDHQTTIVGPLLTKLGDDRRALVIFNDQSLGNRSMQRKVPLFSRYLNFLIA